MSAFDPSALVADYGNWQAETLACRRECALLDFSFMPRVQAAVGDLRVGPALCQLNYG